MNRFLKLEKLSIGVGDRFASQAKPQLRACMMAASKGVEVVPVWNKSNREHLIIGSEPAATRAAADKAVEELSWRKPYHVDADHIRLETVDRFIPYADFYTIDVADWIGKPATPSAVRSFVSVIGACGEAVDSWGRGTFRYHRRTVRAHGGKISACRAGGGEGLPPRGQR